MKDAKLACLLALSHAVAIGIGIAPTAAWGRLGDPATVAVPRLVRDLEDDQPVRPSYRGWAWSVDEGTVALGGRTLWRLGEPGTEPRPLLRGVSEWSVDDLGDGGLVVTGFNLDGQFGTWVTEGEQVHQVGPANWWLVGPPARRGDTILEGRRILHPEMGCGRCRSSPSPNGWAQATSLDSAAIQPGRSSVPRWWLHRWAS